MQKGTLEALLERKIQVREVNFLCKFFLVWRYLGENLCFDRWCFYFMCEFKWDKAKNILPNVGWCFFDCVSISLLSIYNIYTWVCYCEIIL